MLSLVLSLVLSFMLSFVLTSVHLTMTMHLKQVLLNYYLISLHKIMTDTLTWLSWKVGPGRFKRGRLLVAYHNISQSKNFLSTFQSTHVTGFKYQLDYSQSVFYFVPQDSHSQAGSTININRISPWLTRKYSQNFSPREPWLFAKDICWGENIS